MSYSWGNDVFVNLIKATFPTGHTSSSYFFPMGYTAQSLAPLLKGAEGWSAKWVLQKGEF